MISASEFRNGITIEKDGSVLEVVEFQHVKPGKGAAFVRTKLKDIINGGVTEEGISVSVSGRRSLCIYGHRDL